jgi:alkanesulfonate monooxygenase SsuD/methylene tetrahydromethanopterin reductase-like flavin-dependent oxidoreductase (luciferase family)
MSLCRGAWLGQSRGAYPTPAYDALETLAWIAAKTERVRLHTAILVPLFQQPVVLARRVATIDPSVRRAARRRSWTTCGAP